MFEARPSFKARCRNSPRRPATRAAINPLAQFSRMPAEGPPASQAVPGRFRSRVGSGTTSLALPICQPCREHRDCPLNDSFCIRDRGADVGFCGFGCSRNECPAGHACAFIGGLPVPQCVPVLGTCPATIGNTLGVVASQMDMSSLRIWSGWGSGLS